MRLITFISILIILSGAIIFDITDFKLTGLFIAFIGFLLDDIIETDKVERENDDEESTI